MAEASPGLSAWGLLQTAAAPTLQVCLLSAVGVLLAHTGILHERGCQTLARLCFYVFTPALTFGKLAQAMSLGAIAHLWPLLASTTLSIVLGLGVGWAVAAVLRTPPAYRMHVTAAIAFGNVGNLPLVFVYTLCHDTRAVFHASMGEACEHKGVAYVAFNICAATLWQFTLAINMLRPRGAAAAEVDAAAAAAEAEDSAEAGGQLLKHPTLSELLAQQRQQQQQRSPPLSPGGSRSSSGKQAVGDGIELQPALGLPTWQREDAALLARPHDLGASAAAVAPASVVSRWAQWLGGVEWGQAFPLPTQAAVGGIAVGCIPPLKALLYSPDPPLRVVAETLGTLGGGLIPTTIPLLGAVLYRGPGRSQLPLRVVLGVLLTRLVLLPALLTALAAAALWLRLFSSPDPMFLFTLLLSNATPTAINMQTLTVLYRHGEAEMSTILFYQYLAASVITLPAWSWLFLRIIAAFP